MTWLFSLYWLGALTLVGPVIFHMWRRSPQSVRAFSTLMFITPSPPRITSRSRVEHWILMLLRASALVLLALAFTRPIWRSQTSEPDGPSDEQLVAILVDTSASMRRDGLWDDLIRQLDERLSDLPKNTTVALYRFDQQCIPVVSFRDLKSAEPSARREIVRTRLRELKPTWGSTHLGEALVRTAMVMQEVQTEWRKPVPRRIWLASDLQAGAETVALQGYEWPDDLPVEIIAGKPQIASNAGLQVVEKNVDAADDVLRLRVTNAADSTKEQFTLKWDSPGTTELSVYVPPGQSRVVVPPKRPEGNTARSIKLAGDDQSFDNRVYVAETVVESRLVVYCGPEAPNDTEGARFYLDRVFSASPRFRIELKDWRDANAASADSQPALIVLVQPEPESQSMIRSHLARGGTVLIASPSSESMLASLKLCGRDEISVNEANVSRYAMLGEIDYAHPVFVPFAESQFSDFTGIRFWKHRTMTGLKETESRAGDDRGASTESRDRVLARFDDGDAAIVELPVGRGRILAFTSGWQPADSQFARSSKFPMLMFRLLENAAGVTTRSTNQPVGSPLVWPKVASGESASTGTVVLPDGRELASLPLDRPFLQSDEPGLYRLSVAGRTEMIAVNLAADESRTAPMTVEQLEAFGLTLKARERPAEIQRQRDRQRQLQLAELEQSQKLWQIVLFVAGGILLLETLLSGFYGSKSPSGTGTLPTTVA